VGSPIDVLVKTLLSPKRIDAYLTEALSGEYSREEVKRSLQQGAVLLNGRAARPRDAVREGDRITGTLTSGKPLKAEGEDIPLSVIYEDESLLVVDKPVGLVVHPGAGNKTGTLVNALLGRKTPLSSLGGDQRPGIVHRLDKETSGLLLVAKTNLAHRKLQAQFAERSLSKTYITLVRGRVDYEEGRVDLPLGRDAKERRKMNVVREGEGREALSHYRVVRRFKHATLLHVRIVTGRTHQIRVHMKHLGYPVAGDTLYGPPREKNERRLALHAAKIEFVHPKTGKMMSFESPIPAAMQAMIDDAEKS
jgi:23S rRNA pseudouridine1911/1915/1917 synthase